MNIPNNNILILCIFFCAFYSLSAQNHAIDSLIALNKITPENKKEKVTNLNFLSSLLSYRKPLLAIAYSNEALRLSEKFNDSVGKINATRQLSIAYMNINYDSARKYIHTSIQLSKQYRKKKGESSALNTLGNIYLEHAQIKDALDCYLNALKLSEETNDKMNAPMRLVNVGRAHLFDKNYIQSKNYLLRAIQSVESESQQKNINALSYALLNMAQLMQELGNLDSAKIYCEKALAVEVGTIHHANRKESLVTLASIYQKKGNFDLAKRYLQACLDEAIQSQDIAMMALVYNKFSYLNQAQKTWKEAVDFAHLSLHFADSTYTIGLKKDAYLALSESYAGLKNFEKAFEYQISYKKISDSILVLNKSAQVQELQTKYEVAKKETENEVLRHTQIEKDKSIKVQKTIIAAMAIMMCLIGVLSFSLFHSRRREKQINQELQEKNALLADLNIVKDKLFSIIGHDLRSPINSLKSMMLLLIDNTLSENQVRALFEKLIKEVNYTSDMLDNLLYWAKAQLQGMKPNIQTIDIQRIISSTVDLLQGIAEQKDIRIANEVADTIHAVGDEEMIKTVIRNLIANALKFTPPQGEVVISAQKNANQIVIKIQDSGVGMSAETLSKLFKGNITTRGTFNEKGTGLGLLMVKDFLEKNSGSIQVESAVGKGSVFSIHLPATA